MPRERQRVRQFALALDAASAVDDLSLAPLARLADSLHDVGTAHRSAGPTDTFRAALRTRLIAVGATQNTPAGGLPQPAPWRKRLVAASAVVAITTGSAGGLAVASSDALPGDRLYEVKRAIENVRLALAPNDLARAERYLAIASTRLTEINALLAQSANPAADPVLIEELRETMSAMAEAVAAGSALFFEVFERTGDASVLVPLSEFLAERSAGLTDVRELLPAELLGSQDSLLVELEDLAARVAGATGGEQSLALVAGPLAKDRAGRTAERNLITDANAAVAQAMAAMRAAAEAAQAQTAEATAQTAPPEQREATTPETVQRDVSRLVEVNVVGRDGSIDQVDVDTMKGTATANKLSTGSLRGTPTTGAGSASARAFDTLPVPDGDLIAAVPGSLSASFDPSGARYAHFSAS